MSAIDTLNKLVSVKNAIRTAIKSKFSSDPGTDFSAYASKIKSKDNLANLFNGQATSPPISKSYTGKPTSLYRMYASTSGTSTDVSNLDTSNVTNMASMFDTCKSLTSIGDLSNWDTSKVTNMTSMFYNCQSLASVGDLSNWNTSKVTTMPYMFFKYGGTELNLANWDTSKVTDMNSVIYNCVNCTSVDVSGWDLSSCTNITYIYDWMFKLTNLILGEGWGKSPSSLTLGLNHIASKLTDESWTSFKSMYDRASNDLPTMTIKFSTNQKTNYTDWSNFVDYMTNKGYTITVV